MMNVEGGSVTSWIKRLMVIIREMKREFLGIFTIAFSPFDY